MSYFKNEPVTITKMVCTHPLVKRFWQYGGGALTPTNSELYMISCFQISDTEVKEIKHINANDWEQEANDFLDKLTAEEKLKIEIK